MAGSSPIGSRHQLLRGFQNSRDRCLFSVALFSGARINEVCSLLTNDVYNTKAAVRI